MICCSPSLKFRVGAGFAPRQLDQRHTRLKLVCSDQFLDYCVKRGRTNPKGMLTKCLGRTSYGFGPVALLHLTK